MKDGIVFTIARQYGSGGRTVGEMLADRHDIHFYDKELVVLASEHSGINEALFRNADEKVKKRASLFGMVKKVYNGNIISPDSEEFVSDDNLFNYEAETIKKLAEGKSCVIVGRAADFVLKDYPNKISVFVHADQDFLMQEAAKKQSYRGEELRKFIEKVDKNRADFYRYYTGNNWEDARNYDLCLNSGVLGFEKCVEAIEAYAKVRFGADIFD